MINVQMAITTKAVCVLMGDSVPDIGNRDGHLWPLWEADSNRQGSSKSHSITAKPSGLYSIPRNGVSPTSVAQFDPLGI